MGLGFFWGVGVGLGFELFVVFVFFLTDLCQCVLTETDVQNKEG